MDQTLGNLKYMFTGNPYDEWGNRRHYGPDLPYPWADMTNPRRNERYRFYEGGEPFRSTPSWKPERSYIEEILKYLGQ